MNNKPTFTVYVTKYALTEGVQKKLVASTGIPTMVEEAGEGHTVYYHGEGKNWHRTLEGAEQRARKMRDAKIAALQKQIEKLRKMTFTAIN